MKIYHEMVKRECAARGISIQELLKAAGVSSNAYYSLASKENAVPRSVTRIAQVLGIPATKLFFDADSLLEKQIRLLSRVDEIATRNPSLDRDTIRHTLTLLDEPPIDRLRRALELGRLRLTD